MNTKVLKSMSAFMIIVMVALAVFSALLTLQAESISGTQIPKPLWDGGSIAGTQLPNPLWGGDNGQAIAGKGVPNPFGGGLVEILGAGFIPKSLFQYDSVAPQTMAAGGNGKWYPDLLPGDSGVSQEIAMAHTQLPDPYPW